LAWSPDGRYWLIGTWQGPIHLCGATSGTEYETYRGLSRGAVGIGWSSDGDRVLAVSDHGEYGRWQMFDGRVLELVRHGTGAPSSAVWSPDLQMVTITYGDGRVECRYVSDWHLGWAIGGGERGTANCAAWSPDGSMIASVAEGGVRTWRHSDALKLWASRPVQLGHWNDASDVSPPERELTGPTRASTWASFSCDGQFLGVRTRQRALQLWRCDSWDLVAAAGESGNWTRGALIAFHPREPVLATVNQNAQLEI
jgi:WD40 repeat protein